MSKDSQQELADAGIKQRREEAVRRAREYFEAQRWPNGEVSCVHCGSFNIPPKPHKDMKLGKRKPTSSQASEKKR